MSAFTFRFPSWRRQVTFIALMVAFLAAGDSSADESAAVAKALAQQTALEFVDQPLSDVVDYLKTRHAIEIQMDHDVMDDSGVGSSVAVSCRLNHVTLAAALESVLAPLGLSYIVADDVVMITSRERAQDFSRRSIASSQSQRPMEAKIEAALDEKTDLDFTDQPISDVVDYLKNRHEIEIQFDTKALADAGVGSSTAITRSLKGVTLQSALSLMLDGLDLDYAIRDEVLLITTKNAMRTMRELRVYPIYDLVVLPGEMPNEDDDELRRDYQPLIAAVRSALGKDAEADIQAYPLTGSLIVNASFDAQRRVRKLFDLLRQVRRQQGPSAILPE